MKAWIIDFIFKILRFVAATCPKNNKIVLFGAMNGQFFGDNARHLFEWMLENTPGIRVVWITKKPKVYFQMKAMGMPVAMSKSLRGFIYLCRATIGVFTNSLYDFCESPVLIPTNFRLIALRHGRSVKRVRFARKSHKITPKESGERKREAELIKLVISTSPFISKMQEECLRVGNNKHVVTGYPRNDLFFKPNLPTSQEINKLVASGRKMVLYAPSWRHGRNPTQFFPFSDFELTKLVDILDASNLLLLLRPHVNDLRKYESTRLFLMNLAHHGNPIRIASHDQIPDVNTLLPHVDALISDYSAIYHDYLLLDRPMGFIPYDYDDFNRQNGFLYDYFALLPGPVLSTFSDFCLFLESLADGEDMYRDSRHNLRDMIHTYQDGNSCARVAELILEMV